jgi:hypothetical protein
MDVRITGNMEDGFAWSDGISEVSGFDTPEEALADYMRQYGYVKVNHLETGLQHR